MLSRITCAVVVIALAVGVSAESALAGVPQAQKDHFAALRHAPSSSVPAEVKRFATSEVPAGLGINPSETRRVAAPDGGRWDVLSGSEGICLFDESEQTGTCATTADAIAGRLSMLFVAPSQERVTPGASYTVPENTPRHVVGILPDDALSVTASSAVGNSLAARSNKDGLYRLSSSAGPVGTMTMRRAGNRAMKITPARQRGSASVKARASACTPGINCAHAPIPVSGRNYWENYAFYSGQWGTWSGVREVDIYSKDTNTICGNAYNPDNTWAGNFFCINTTAYGIGHPYAGSLRIPWAGPGAPSASVLGVAYWLY